MSQGFINQAPVYSGYTAPTRQIFTSGSGTYTTPAGVLYILVETVGGGGGGAGSGTTGGSAPGAGGNTTFSTVTSTGGGAANFYVAGAGGTPTGGDINIPGGGGATSSQLPTTITGSEQLNGGSGGNSYFGGGARGGQIGGGAGQAASTNTGGGGGGGATINTSNIVAGAGGGAGGYARKQINSPAATYSYAVGAAGSAGGAGTSGYAGGAGAAGIIIVTEFYQLNTYGELLTFSGTGSVVKETARTAWTPGFTGFSANPTTSGFTYIKQGKQCLINMPAVVGTSNAVTLTITGLPFTSAATDQWIAIPFPFDNTANSTATCMGLIAASSTTLECYLAGNSAGWTASGTKMAIGTFTYETA